ncbi:hypothetical protein [Halocatena marina]|nr:hypothetical protein [Halocatena marina]
MVRFTEIEANQALEYDPKVDETSIYLDPTAPAVGSHKGLDENL